MTVPLLILVVVVLLGLAWAGAVSDYDELSPLALAIAMAALLAIGFLFGRWHMKSPTIQFYPPEPPAPQAGKEAGGP